MPDLLSAKIFRHPPAVSASSCRSAFWPPVETHTARGRQAAENADGAAYADALSEYAALGQDELREAARAAVPAISDRG